MIEIIKSDDRGVASHGWLNSKFSFSFSDYYEPDRMGFRALRVINEDWIEPGTGFGMHPHSDMEIITYILQGSLEHKDNMGNKGLIRHGEIQHISAGTGIFHSEYNPSKTEKTHLLQIWLFPNEFGIKPSYDQKQILSEADKNRIQLIASNDPNKPGIAMHQDAAIYAGLLERGKSISHPLGQSRYGWLQLAKGELTLNGTTIQEGDGAAIAGEKELAITGVADESEYLLFDLA